MTVNRKIVVLAVAVAALALSAVLRDLLPHGASGAAGRDAPAQPQRIVSLSPSITETLFALGLGDRVVGVTRYCTHPPEARGRRQVGGYYDPGYEAVVALMPDLVVLREDHDRVRRVLLGLGLEVLSVEHRTLEGVLDSVPAIGRAAGVGPRADVLLASLRERMAAVSARAPRANRPRALVCVGRTVGSGRLEDVYIAGRDGFYDRMLRLAGGANAYTGRLPFPAVAAEGILMLDPDVIIDLVPDPERLAGGEAELRRDWESLPNVRAVRDGRVYVFGEDYVTIPGPRFVLTLERIARALHPGAAPGGTGEATP